MAPTLTWCTGFEYGLAAPVTSGGGIADLGTGTGCSIQNSVVRTGSYALQINTSAAAMSIGKNIIGSPTAVAFRVYINFGTQPASEGVAIAWQYHASALFSIKYFDSTKRLYASVGSGSVKSGPIVNAGTWYRIDYLADCSGTTWTMDWSVDGAPQTQATETGHSASTFSGGSNRIGFSGAVTGNIYYDDVARSETGTDFPIGAGGVIGLRPNADGTHNNAANTLEDIDGNDIDGVTYFAFDKLDENPWVNTANADFVRQTAIEATKYCEIQFADTTQNNIHGVRAIQQDAASGTPANNAKSYIIDSDAQSTTLFDGDTSNTSAFYRSVQVLTPAGGWTQAYVNSLKCRFGYSSDVGPSANPYWLAIMLEVAYGPAVASTWIPKVIMI